MKNEEVITIDWSKRQCQQFQTDFLTWYALEKRELPWRENDDPYRVWISEIMLQQTRVDTVIPYFLRFMERFPTIQSLADADEDLLLKTWEGLGYYSRARNLQTAAQQIVTQFGGVMPHLPEELATLKGIGPYTVGAIASIAFHQAEPAVDGNVMRVFSRMFDRAEDIAKPASRKVFDQLVRQVIAEEDPASFNQAIMDLGATICTPTSPKCATCPVQRYCAAYQKGNQLERPVKSKKIKAKPVYYRAEAIQNSEGAFLLVKRPGTGLLANMWTFPLVELSSETYQQRKGQQDTAQQSLFVAEPSEPLPLQSEIIWQKEAVGEITHVFSHLKWFVLLEYGRIKAADFSGFSLSQEHAWVQVQDFERYVFPKPQQKIVALLQKNAID